MTKRNWIGFPLCLFYIIFVDYFHLIIMCIHIRSMKFIHNNWRYKLKKKVANKCKRVPFLVLEKDLVVVHCMSSVLVAYRNWHYRHWYKQKSDESFYVKGSLKKIFSAFFRLNIFQTMCWPKILCKLSIVNTKTLRKFNNVNISHYYI